jgi:primosomal protein N' (replication factor Y)
MEFVDIVFPQKVGVLTYSVPERLRDKVRPGMQVTAELRRAGKRGIVLREARDVPPGRIKPISALHPEAPALGPALLELVSWTADYYICPEGTALKSIVPREFFEPVKKRASRKHKGLPPVSADLPLPDGESLKEVRKSTASGGYRCFLLHAPGTDYERAFAVEAARGLKGVIVAAPDLAAVSLLEAPMREIFGKGLVLLHSGLNRGERREAVERIASGGAEAVLGSLMAVYAPMPRVGLIALLHEESPLYKSESAPYSSARDSAVMRGYLEKATVLLSSICPSVESWHNAEKGKYTLLDHAGEGQRPRVRVIGTRPGEGVVSKSLMDAVIRRTDEGGRALLYLNRKGHSTLRCAECGHMELCPLCNVPMVLHKKDRALRCALCGRRSPLPRTCPGCRGHALEPSGAGLERLEEELAALRPVGVDTGTRKRISVLMEEGGSGVAVGTRTLTRSDALSRGFEVVGVVRADGFLFQPDFRATERAMQDIMYSADKTAPGGELLIQTSRPRHRLWSHARRFNLKGFYAREIKERKGPGFPPHARLAVIRAGGDKRPMVDTSGIEGVEVLGPVAALDRRGEKGWKALVKAPTSAALHEAVREVLKAMGPGARADVDPVDL